VISYLNNDLTLLYLRAGRLLRVITCMPSAEAVFEQRQEINESP